MRQYPIISLLTLCTLVGCGSVDGSPGYDDLQQASHGARITGATVTRAGSDFQLAWTTNGTVDKVRIYTGTDSDNLETLSLKVEDVNSALVTGLAPGLRHYFRLKGGSGNGIVVGERGVPQSNVINFRDIGGYISTLHHNDKSIAWGKFFRSGNVPANANTAFLSTLGIRVVIDTRNPTEIAQAGPQNLPGVPVINRPIYDSVNSADPFAPHFCQPGNQTPACYAAQEAFFGTNGENVRALKNSIFRAAITGVGPHPFNFGDTPKDAIRTLMQTLADPQNLPILWADSGGEFRCGFGVAITQLILGVSEDQVVADYALSTQFRQPVITATLNQLVASGLLQSAEYLRPQLTAYPEFMESLLDQLHQDYGTAINYVHSLGITDAQIGQIRQNLLRE